MGRLGICSFPLIVLAAHFACFYNINGSASSDHEQAVRQKGCNVYEGKWVYDESYPLFNSTKCPLIRKEFNCVKYGRSDLQYLKYRWQPNDCDLPRFDGVLFLRRMRGKKIMFVGDSTSMNQWQSLTCLLYTSVYGSNVTRQADDLTSTVTFQRYGVSVIYFGSQYLVDIEMEQFGRVLKLNSLKSGDIWKQVDVLIFNTGLWWHRRGVKQRWDYVEDDGIIMEDMDRMDALSKALRTWAKWVESDVDSYTTKIFFRGISPAHYKGIEWGQHGVWNCLKETRPLKGSTYPSGAPLEDKLVKDLLVSVAANLSASDHFVHLLDITRLSQLRTDGHPGSHNGVGRLDCTHWCVAGVPDTWNHLLYAQLMPQRRDDVYYFTSDDYL